MEDIDEFLDMKAGAQDGKIKKRQRTQSEGSSELLEPPKKVWGKICALKPWHFIFGSFLVK